MKDLSVIVACARPQAVSACLEALAGQTEAARLEAIVVGDVDHGSSRVGELDVVWISCRERHANVRRNLGLARAQAPLIAFLDDDAVPLEGWAAAALRWKPEGRVIATGPEFPVDRGPWSSLAYAVSLNRLCEGNRSHVNRSFASISWWEVPFCNLIVPKRVLEKTGPLAEGIPWDMDDFDLCRRARSFVEFRNDPSLSIRHDRYPDSIFSFLNYRWKIRVRTGEKVISHPNLYCRIPPVIACAFFPWVIVLLGLFLPVGPGVFLAGLLSVYIVVLLSQMGAAYRFGGVRGTGPYLGLLAAMHGAALAGVQAGMLRGVWKKISSRNGP